MTSDQDQAKLIAERVARRLAGSSGSPTLPSGTPKIYRNGSPVSEELSALREGLHDLENKLDRIESRIVQGGEQKPTGRARVIDFVSSGPPLRSAPSTKSEPKPAAEKRSQFVPPTQSPWLSSLSSMFGQTSQTGSQNIQTPSHPSQERFGVEEATVSELVEFFENERKCSLDPAGKPCDHCAMCSSRGF